MAQFNTNILGGRFAIVKDLGAGISGEVKLGIDIAVSTSYAAKLHYALLTILYSLVNHLH